MQSEFSSDEEALAAIMVAIHKLGDCSFDGCEKHACLSWEVSLSSADFQAAEHLVKQLRDELQHYKSNFNDSFDQSDRTLDLRQQAREVVKKVHNHFVLSRRPDLVSLIKR